MNNDNDNYSKFCKVQFEVLRKKDDELAASFNEHYEDILKVLSELNRRLYIDNGSKSLVTRIAENQASALVLLRHLDEHAALRKDWADVFYDLIKKGAWAIVLLFIGFCYNKWAH